MTLKDLLKKRSHISNPSTSSSTTASSFENIPPAPEREIPEFTFIRTTTETEEIISPPSFPGDEPDPAPPAHTLFAHKHRDKENHKEHREDKHAQAPETNLSPKKSRPNPFRKLSNASRKDSMDGSPKKEKRERSNTRTSDGAQEEVEAPKITLPSRPKNERKLSERLHLRSRTASSASVNLPEGLPDAPAALPAPAVAPGSVEETKVKKEREKEKAQGRLSSDGTKDDGVHKAETEAREAQWEKRATVLALGNPLAHDGSRSWAAETERTALEQKATRTRRQSVTDTDTEDTIQEAIRLHEAGDLERSTAIFGRLADPKGANNPLSQVLYGLALRHGWGIEVRPEEAIHYLSLAASNSASIESAALSSGYAKGGDAKGELVLAIFELANCFRYAWGVKKDPVAARSYYETAANLGDLDAAEEVAWCFVEGFGGPKDKVCLSFFLFR